MPLTKAVGTKTAHNTSATAMIGALTSRIALNDASKGARPLSILRCTFSTTTIASSTTLTIASTNPKSDRLLSDNPIAAIAANVPINDTGTARSGIMEALQD